MICTFDLKIKTNKMSFMRNLLFLIAICTFPFWATAQYSKKANENYSARFGVKLLGGAILTHPEVTYVGNDKDQVIHEVTLSGSVPQISAGIWGQKRFGWLYAEGNMMVSRYGMKFDVNSYDTDWKETRTLTEKFTYVDLQVMGGLISNGFRIGVGPVMHILAGHDSALESLESYNQSLRKISYGFSGCVGYDLGRVSFDVKYDKAFRTVGDHIYYRNKKSLFLETPDALVFSVAYAISR